MLKSLPCAPRRAEILSNHGNRNFHSIQGGARHHICRIYSILHLDGCWRGGFFCSICSQRPIRHSFQGLGLHVFPLRGLRGDSWGSVRPACRAWKFGQGAFSGGDHRVRRSRFGPRGHRLPSGDPDVCATENGQGPVESDPVLGGATTFVGIRIRLEISRRRCFF